MHVVQALSMDDFDDIFGWDEEDTQGAASLKKGSFCRCCCYDLKPCYSSILSSGKISNLPASAVVSNCTYAKADCPLQALLACLLCHLSFWENEDRLLAEYDWDLAVAMLSSVEPYKRVSTCCLASLIKCKRRRRGLLPGLEILQVLLHPQCGVCCTWHDIKASMQSAAVALICRFQS